MKPRKLELPAHNVQVWKASIQNWTPHGEFLRQRLSSEESAHAGKIQHDGGRKLYEIGRGLLRQLIGSYAGCSAAGLQLLTGPQGKPRVGAEVGIEFNVSHSVDLILLAFCRTGRVGIDVEKIQPIQRIDLVAAEIFSPSDLATFKTLCESEALRMLFESWTLKEASLKASGEGLAGSGAEPSEIPMKSWRLEVGPAYVATVVAEDADASVTIRDADELPLFYQRLASPS